MMEKDRYKAERAAHANSSSPINFRTKVIHSFSSTNKYIDRRHRSRILYLPRSRGFRLRFRFEKNDGIEGELILHAEK